MTTTTSYGTWNNRVEPYSLTVEHTVTEALGEFAGDYNIDAIVRDYRTAIDKALPEGVSLVGDEFIGPYNPSDATWSRELEDEDGCLDIKTLVEGVDLMAIVERHERTA